MVFRLIIQLEITNSEFLTVWLRGHDVQSDRSNTDSVLREDDRSVSPMCHLGWVKLIPFKNQLNFIGKIGESLSVIKRFALGAKKGP